MLIAVAALTSLFLSTAQSLINQRIGSDHAVHAFLASRIRRNGYRLFVRVPDLLNDCYCAALPLYIHSLVARLPPQALYWVERLLNPVVNALHVVLVALIARHFQHQLGVGPLFAPLVALLFALTPQFYHALSARNFGLSARGIGLLLLTALFFDAYLVHDRVEPGLTVSALVILAWLVWGFSTFAQQALCILAVLVFVLRGDATVLLAAVAGVALFVALHPRYSFGYLRHTLRFIRTYATSLAPIYILARRPSIWRDLVRDIPRRFVTDSAARAWRYAYENSVLVVMLLNPLSILALRPAFVHRPGALGWAASLALSGILAAFLTSFRKTRFLGEPERYVEITTPWSTLVFAAAVGASGAMGVGFAVAIGFLLIDVLQLFASRRLVQHVTRAGPDLAQIEELIEARWGSAARVCCNNEHYTKLLMQHDWQYAYCLAVGEPYCGMPVTEAFSRFPILRREALLRIVSTLRINACLLDRSEYEALGEDDALLAARVSVAYESQQFRLLFIEWPAVAALM